MLLTIHSLRSLLHSMTLDSRVMILYLTADRLETTFLREVKKNTLTNKPSHYPPSPTAHPPSLNCVSPSFASNDVTKQILHTMKVARCRHAGQRKHHLCLSLQLISVLTPIFQSDSQNTKFSECTRVAFSGLWRRVVMCCLLLQGENGGSIFLRKDGNLPQCYTAS